MSLGSGKFGAPAPKCVECNDSVYAQEQIVYDQKVWHQNCFKCNECRSVVTLSKVAMISGTLYCKNCFKKIFLKEGKYTSFDAKAGATAGAGAAAGANDGSSSSSDGNTLSITTGRHQSQPSVGGNFMVSFTSMDASPPPKPDGGSALSPTPQTQVHGRSASISVAAASASSQLPPKSPAAPPASASSSSSSSSLPQQKLHEANARFFFDAVDSGNDKRVRELITEFGVGPLFITNNKQETPIQAAFNSRNSVACGVTMLEAIREKLDAAEAAAAKKS